MSQGRFNLSDVYLTAEQECEVKSENVKSRIRIPEDLLSYMCSVDKQK